MHWLMCIVTINVMWLFLTGPWVGLQCVSVVFPDQTHLLLVVVNLISALVLSHLSYYKTNAWKNNVNYNI